MDNEDDDNLDSDPFTLPRPAELFRRDYAAFYNGYSEGRVLVDPAWFDLGDPSRDFTAFHQIIRYAEAVSIPTKVNLLFPKYLRLPNARTYVGAFFYNDELRETVRTPRRESALPVAGVGFTRVILRDCGEARFPFRSENSCRSRPK